MLRLRNRAGEGKNQERFMLEQDTTARIRATIEEELGSFRPFADLPATELEAMAARITRAIAPLIGIEPAERSAA
jgi:hypothetical protein